VKRQTINAMKYMQQVVRVQSQIQSRRIKMLENQAQVEKDEAKWAASEAGNDNWDDSVLTKEERDSRSQRKTDAIIKRERSMAYAYSRKVILNPSSCHHHVDVHFKSFPTYLSLCSCGRTVLSLLRTIVLSLNGGTGWTGRILLLVLHRAIANHKEISG